VHLLHQTQTVALLPLLHRLLLLDLAEHLLLYFKRLLRATPTHELLKQLHRHLELRLPQQ
jgi:hypothetical protein